MSTPTSSKLPQLLSLLPQSGLHTLVRPLSPPPRLKDSLFLITRTHLKYKLLPPKPVPTTSTSTSTSTPTTNRSGNNTASTAKAAPIAPRKSKLLKIKRDNVGGGMGVDELMGGEGEMLVYGKAWGMQFRNGKFTPHSSITKIPDPLIEPHKIQWISVPRSSLSPEETTAVDNWRTTYESAMANRAELLSARKAEGSVRREAYEKKVKLEDEEKTRLKKEGNLVRIIY